MAETVPRREELPAPQTPEIYQFGPFSLDVGAQQLERDGQVMDLTPKAFHTLVVLIQRRGRVVTKDEIISVVWPNAFVSDDSLSQSIWMLRRVLGDQTNQPQYIATLPRRGYRFIATVTEGAAATPTPDVPAPSQAGTTGPLEPAEHPEVAKRVPRRRQSWAYGAAVLTISALAALATRRVTTTSGIEPFESPARFTLTPPAGVTVAEVGAFSPDSQSLAFVGRDDGSGQTKIWLRALRSGDDKPLAGTEGAIGPFWSPDSQSLAFFSGGNLKTLSLATDSVQVLVKAGLHPRGGAWGPDGTILFNGPTSEVFSVRVGGQATAITSLDTARESAHRWPQFLPDGRHFLFHVMSRDPERRGTYVGSLDSPDRTRLSSALMVVAQHAVPGYVLYFRGHALVAQRFDTTALRLTGEPITVIASVPGGESSSTPTLVSASGNLLAFVGSAGAHHLEWFNRSGQRLGAVATPLPLHFPRLMPNGRQLLGHSEDPERPGSWLVDLESGAANRLLPEGRAPVPSPDGSRFAFEWSKTSGASDIYVQQIAGSGAEELLLATPEFKFVDDWSPDGRYIVYVAASRVDSDTDLWLLPMFGERKPIPFLKTPYNELQSQVSPDGRWLAYTSDKSGAWEVYVRAFPSASGERALSAGGGGEPRWSRDGSTLYYLAPSHWLMSVHVAPGDPGSFGKPTPLFRAPVTDPLIQTTNHYMVGADARRFLIDTPDADAAATPISMVINWRALLQP
jgi:DNA-binding winged helix-turn-helix (wHTH) protein/Tol biopolymer transport system component